MRLAGALAHAAPLGLRRRARAARDTYRRRRFRSEIRVDAAAPTLLVSPHLDDAVLDCWDLLAGRGQVLVANLFTGAPPAGTLAGWDAITGARDSRERVAERIAEDARALALAGREAANLPFLDAQYRRPGSAPSVAEIDRALAAVVPVAARVFAPAGIGGHPDHLLARRYACLLAAAGMPVSLYAELPYCVRHGWPAWVDGAEPDPLRDVDAFWSEQLLGVPGLPALRSALATRLEDRACEDKLRAMRCYASQLPALDFAARGVLSDPDVYRYEVHWMLSGPAHRAG